MRRIPRLQELLAQMLRIEEHPHVSTNFKCLGTLESANIGLGFSCLKSSILCVYAAPETRVNFHAKQAFPQAESCFHVFEIETKPEQRRFDIELIKPKSGAELRTVANVYQTLCRLQPSDIPFDNPSDKAAFGFWVTSTGPRLNQYHVGLQFFKNNVPQFAWRSKAVRELAIAVVCVDEKWLRTMRKPSSDSISQATGHYYKALQNIQEGGNSKLEILVAAELAFTLDSMLFNFKSGQVHLRGVRSLIEELEVEALESRNHSTYEFVHDTMRSLLATSEGHQAMMLNSRPDIADPSLLARFNAVAYKALRDQMSRYLKQYRDLNHLTPELRQFPNTWKEGVASYQQSGQEPLALKEAMHLFFVIAVTLALKEKEWVNKYGDHTKAPDYVLKRITILLKMRHDLNKEDSELLGETLKIALMHLFDLFPDQMEWWVRRDLIEKIAQEDYQVFERTAVLKMMNIDYGALPRVLVADVP